MKAGHWCGIAVASLQLLLAPSPARATDGFRCGQWLVQVGDTTAAVRSKCGEPASQELRRVRRGPVIEIWVYNFGSRMFMQEATFENGRLVRTEQLGYGQ